MELKVWCDGIQRVVCGASASTTCQDIVFALAHATGQTGRFILIEQWRNNEKVLAPSDRPLATLARWGEYANDVTFIMKRSGNVSTTSTTTSTSSTTATVASTQTLPKATTTTTKLSSTAAVKSNGLNFKSDSELLHKRKELVNHSYHHNQFTGGGDNNKEYCNLGRGYNTGSEQYPPNQQQSQPLVAHCNTLPSRNKVEPFVRSISFHKPSSHLVDSSHHFNSRSITHHQHNHHINGNNNSGGIAAAAPTPTPNIFNNEPIYGSLAKNRPRQPPPYKEAIAKSTLLNKITSTSNGGGGGFVNNTDSLVSASSQFGSSSKESSPSAKFQQQHLNANKSQVVKSSHNFLPTTMINNNNNGHAGQKQQQQQQCFGSEEYSPNNVKKLSTLHHDTINLLDMQQQTIKSQERDIVNIEQELNLVQRKLSENELIVKRYQDEMELLKQLWIEQEMLIEKLEAEHMEEELEQLITQAGKYDDEMNDIKDKLANCEAEVVKCRGEICKLMNAIDDVLESKQQGGDGATTGHESGDGDDDADSDLVEHICSSIEDKTKEIDSQKCDLNSLTNSIEQLDQVIQEKTDTIDKLVIEIKEANVEGLSLQSATLYVEERDTPTTTSSSNESTTATTTNTQQQSGPPAPPPSSLLHRSQGSNRKIPVSPHELGNTVPTKKNPDGIWV